MMPDRRYVGALKEGHMPEVHILAIDLAKRSFQICGSDRGGRFCSTGWFPVQSLSRFFMTRLPALLRWRPSPQVTMKWTLVSGPLSPGFKV